MVWFLGVLFAYSVLLVSAPVGTLKVSAVFLLLLGGVFGLLYGTAMWLGTV